MRSNNRQQQRQKHGLMQKTSALQSSAPHKQVAHRKKAQLQPHSNPGEDKLGENNEQVNFRNLVNKRKDNSENVRNNYKYNISHKNGNKIDNQRQSYHKPFSFREAIKPINNPSFKVVKPDNAGKTHKPLEENFNDDDQDLTANYHNRNQKQLIQGQPMSPNIKSKSKNDKKLNFATIDLASKGQSGFQTGTSTQSLNFQQTQMLQTIQINQNIKKMKENAQQMKDILAAEEQQLKDQQSMRSSLGRGSLDTQQAYLTDNHQNSQILRPSIRTHSQYAPNQTFNKESLSMRPASQTINTISNKNHKETRSDEQDRLTIYSPYSSFSQNENGSQLRSHLFTGYKAKSSNTFNQQIQLRKINMSPSDIHPKNYQPRSYVQKLQGPKRFEFHKMSISKIKNHGLLDEDPDVPDLQDSSDGGQDSMPAIKLVNDRSEVDYDKPQIQFSNDIKLNLRNLKHQVMTPQDHLGSRNANKRCTSHDVSSEDGSGEELQIDKSSKQLSQVQYNIINNKNKSKPKPGIQERTLSMNERVKQHLFTRKSSTRNDGSHQGSLSTNRTPNQLNLSTPKPQPKPFHPPREGRGSLFYDENKPRPGPGSKASYNAAAHDTKASNKGKPQLRNVVNAAIGDSDFSEEEINVDDHDVPQPQPSKAKPRQRGFNLIQNHIDKSEDQSMHSSAEISSQYHTLGRIQSAKDFDPSKAPHRKDMRPIKAPGTAGTATHNTREPHPYNRVDPDNKHRAYNKAKGVSKFATDCQDEDEPSAKVHLIHVSGAAMRRREGSLNFRNKSMNSNVSNRFDQQPSSDYHHIDHIRSRLMGSVSPDSFLKSSNTDQKLNFGSRDNSNERQSNQFDDNNYKKIEITECRSFRGEDSLIEREQISHKRSLSSDSGTNMLQKGSFKRAVPDQNLSQSSESCEVNIETYEINSASTFNNKIKTVSINRNIFELSLRLQNLKEVPEAKIKSNQQLKVLDLSHNKIAHLPNDMFLYLPNLVKISLDYNHLVKLTQLSPDKNQPRNLHNMNEPLTKLQVFSVSNNRLIEFPIQLFIIANIHTGQQERRQKNLQQILINDNKIQNIPADIGVLEKLKSLLLHSNPICQLPISLRLIWSNLQEFSIDWFSYLQPIVGRILRLSRDRHQDDQTKKMGPGNELEPSKSPSRLRNEVADTRNRSFIKTVNNSSYIKKQLQKEKVAALMEKFKQMLEDNFSLKTDNKKYVRFVEFVCYFMRQNQQQQDLDIIKQLRYPPQNRTILHQLTEDNKLNLLKDILNIIYQRDQNSKGQMQTPNQQLNLNEVDSENSTILAIALKNKYIDISKFLLQYYSDKIDIQIRSKKLGNQISLAIKSQDFHVIDSILNHRQIKSNDSYILNYIVPNFEKNPTENAKFMVKLILEKGMDPNYLRQKYLRKDLQLAKNKLQNNLPEKILDVSPISLACMKYQNIALNFIIKFNSTIREILKLNKKIKKQSMTQSKNQYLNMANDPGNDPYKQLISQLDSNKQARVQKFFTYIEDISKNKNIPQDQIIEQNLKLFDFNLKSGPNLMHPLHFAVQANNIKAIEKLKRIQNVEEIDFFSRDGLHYDLPQEYAAPSAPVYKIVMKAQKNHLSRKFIEIKNQNNFKINGQQDESLDNFMSPKRLSLNQPSIGQAYLDSLATIYDSKSAQSSLEHANINITHSTYKRSKYVRQADQIIFKNKIIPKKDGHTTYESVDTVIKKNIDYQRKVANSKADPGKKQVMAQTAKTAQSVQEKNKTQMSTMQYKPYQIQQKSIIQNTGEKQMHQDANIARASAVSQATIDLNVNEAPANGGRNLVNPATLTESPQAVPQGPQSPSKMKPQSFYQQLLKTNAGLKSNGAPAKKQYDQQVPKHKAQQKKLIKNKSKFLTQNISRQSLMSGHEFNSEIFDEKTSPLNDMKVNVPQFQMKSGLQKDPSKQNSQNQIKNIIQNQYNKTKSRAQNNHPAVKNKKQTTTKGQNPHEPPNRTSAASQKDKDDSTQQQDTLVGTPERHARKTLKANPPGNENYQSRAQPRLAPPMNSAHHAKGT